MGSRAIRSNVVINLTAENVDSSFRYPDRRLVLTTSKKSMPIGRTSRRAVEFAPRIDNGFFDNPVISRQHAELIADLYFEKVYIKDVGSSHGTFLNGAQVPYGHVVPVHSKDNLTFGVAIGKTPDIYEPCTFKLSFEFGKKSNHDGHENCGTFQVPEEICSDDDSSVEEVDPPTFHPPTERDKQMKDSSQTHGSEGDFKSAMTVDLTSPCPDELYSEEDGHGGPEAQPEREGGSDVEEGSQALGTDDLDLSDVEDTYSIMSEEYESSLSGPESEINDDNGDWFVRSASFYNDDDDDDDDVVPQEPSSSPQGDSRTPPSQEISDHLANPSPLGTTMEVSAISQALSVESRDDTILTLPPIQGGQKVVSSRSAADLTEFFEARKENKKRFPQIEEPFGTSRPNVSADQGQADFVPAVVASDLQADSAVTATLKSTSRDDTIVLTETPWSVSGDKFLSSPLEAQSQLETLSDQPILDETSAYQFQLSKQKINADFVSNPVERGSEEDLEATEHAMTTTELQEQAEEPDPVHSEAAIQDLNSLGKRKIAQISESHDEHPERIAATLPPSEESGLSVTIPLAAPAFSDESRAPKRLRNMAEKAGYMALGGAAAGIALVSAIIATAPTF